MRHTRRTRTHRSSDEHAGLPYGVRILAWSRAVRWIGWGLGEALLPVFIVAFSKTFAEAGLFSSTVDIAALISLPLIGVWADKFSAKKLVLISLLLYPLVGISYFFAGALGMAIFVVIARLANGFTWGLENIGIETYYRRIVDGSHIATSFGYIDTWSHVAWIGAAVVGMGLIVFVPIHVLLLGIAPFALIAYSIAAKAPADSPENALSRREQAKEKKSAFMRSYALALAEWKTWGGHLQLLSVLVFFSSIVSSLMYFFLPIDAYLTGANLPMVVLVTIFGAVPALFGYKLGRLADVKNKYMLLASGLAAMAIIALGLAVFPEYWFKLIAIFCMGIVFELFYVIQSSLITVLGSRETYGARGSVFESIITLGDMVAPLIIGITLDMIGFSNFAAVIAFGGICLAFIYAVAARAEHKRTVS